jgi:hypothetical protein
MSRKTSDLRRSRFTSRFTVSFTASSSSCPRAPGFQKFDVKRTGDGVVVTVIADRDQGST